jgi:tryptophan synthase beta subunit
MKGIGRFKYVTATDDEVIDAFFELSRKEGLSPLWSQLMDLQMQ